MSDDGNLLAYTTDVTGFRAVHAVREGSPHGQAPARSHREGRIGRVGRRRRDALLRHRGRGQATVPALPSRPRRRRRRARVRGDGRAVQPRRGAHAEPALSPRHSASFTTTEVRYHAAAETGAPWRCSCRGSRTTSTRSTTGGGARTSFFYIRTNGGGRRNFRLVTAPVADPRPASWSELIPHRDDVMLEDVEVFATHHVAQERDEG